MIVKKRCDCEDKVACDHFYGFKFKHKNKPYRESCHTANKKQAERIAQKRYNEVVGIVAGLTPEKPLTVAPVLLKTVCADHLTWAQGDHPKTADSKDRLALERFMAFFARPDSQRKYLHEITPFDLERWRGERLKAGDVGRSAVNREYIVIRAMFRQAREWGYLGPQQDDPTEKVDPWYIDRAPVRILSEDEIAQALQGLYGLKEDRYALICRVTLECLPRLSEVLTLTRDDVGPDWLSRTLKGGQRKRVGIEPELAAALRAELRRTGQTYLFEVRTETGEWGHLQQRQASCKFTRLFRRIKMPPGVSHHAFRHTGTTIMLDAGINARAVQELGGWSSLQMLQIYGHVRDAELKRGVAASAAVVKRALAGRGHVGGTKRGTWKTAAFVKR